MKVVKTGYFLMLLLSIGTIWAGCGDKKAQQLQREIAELERKAASNTSDSVLRPLLTRYFSYTKAYPKDLDRNASYYYRAAQVYYVNNNWKEAIRLLEEANVLYANTKVHPEIILMLGFIYEESNDDKKARPLYLTFKQRYPNHPEIAQAEFFFKPEDEKLNARITELQLELYHDKKDKSLNPEKASRLVRYYERYALKYPKDDSSPLYLSEGAKIADQLNQNAKAQELWSLILNRYPNHPNTPFCLFNAAYSSETKNNDLDKARKLYETLLAKYPNHELADDAKISIQNLGKTNEEILQALERKNGKGEK